MTDGSDAKDFDRQQESLDRGLADAGPSFEAGDGRPAGSWARSGQNAVGCGCCGCSSILLLAGFAALLTAASTLVIPAWRVNNRYLANSGVVLDKRLAATKFANPEGGPMAAQKESYRPEVKIRYEVNGRNFEVWSYDATGIYSSDRAAQQAIIDNFQVGSTYPCWYDPDRPEQAVLIRGRAWGVYAPLILPLGLLTVGGAGILMASKILNLRGIEVDPGAGPAVVPTLPRWIRALVPSSSPADGFDPSRFNDPVAMKTDWAPAAPGGSRDRTHNLVQVDLDRLEFRASLRPFLQGLSFFLVGLAALMLGLTRALSSGGFSSSSTLLILGIGLGFACLAGIYLYRLKTPIVFDRQKGLFWKTWTAPDPFSDTQAHGKAAELSKIHALQIICEYVRETVNRMDGTGDSVNTTVTYQCYELNLVMKSGHRINVIDHSDLSRLRQDASTLGEFLGKPVWDATE